MYTLDLAIYIKCLLLKIKSPTPHNPRENFWFAPFQEEEFRNGRDLDPFNKIYFEWKKKQNNIDKEFRGLAGKMGKTWTQVMQLDADNCC